MRLPRFLAPVALQILSVAASALPVQGQEMKGHDMQGPQTGQVTCLAAPYAQPAEDALLARRLAELQRDLRDLLAPAPTLLAAFDRARPSRCLSDRIFGAHGFLDVEANRIWIDARLSPDMQSAILLHEVRHLWQVGRGTCASDDLSMPAYARAVFAMEADASAISLVIAWEAWASGRPGAWQALAGWRSQADIARAFAADIKANGDPVLAASAAFAEWYASPERRQNDYLAACGDYLDRRDATNRLPGGADLSADFFLRLCRMPDGRAYPCAPPADPLAE